MKKTILFTFASLGIISTGAFAQAGTDARSGTPNAQNPAGERPALSDNARDLNLERSQANQQSKSYNKADKDKSHSSWNKSDDHKSMTSDKSSFQGNSDITKVDEQSHQTSLQSSDLIGAEITDGRQHNVGTISDLEVDQSGKVLAAYVDVGGILGIGSSTFRVPYEDLQVSEQQDGTLVTIQQGTLDQLASMSEDLRGQMQDWQDQAQDEMAEAGNELEQTGNSIRNNMNEAGDRVQQFGQNIAAEARQLKNDLKSQFTDDDELSNQVDNMNIVVQDQRIILDGTVTSEDAKDRIVDAAEDAADGREVVDNLEVDENAAQASLNNY